MTSPENSAIENADLNKLYEFSVKKSSLVQFDWNWKSYLYSVGNLSMCVIQMFHNFQVFLGSLSRTAEMMHLIDHVTSLGNSSYRTFESPNDEKRFLFWSNLKPVHILFIQKTDTRGKFSLIKRQQFSITNSCSL